MLVEGRRPDDSEGRMSLDCPALERLSPLDLSNPRVEMHGLPTNVAALAILEGAPLLDGSGELGSESDQARIEHRLTRIRCTSTSAVRTATAG